MKKNYRIRGLLACGLLGLSAITLAQPQPPATGEGLAPRYAEALREGEQAMSVTARVDTVTRTGFYRIVLPPQLVAKCRPDLSDLRIYKPDGTTVPYVLRTAIHDKMNAGYLPLPDPTISQKDSSNKHSYYRLQYDDAYRIERLSLIVSNPILYKRTVRIMAEEDSTGDRAATCVSIDPKDTVFLLPAVKAKTLLIDIANGDNAPLVIRRVVSAQSGIYLLAYLSAGEENRYELGAGDSIEGPPDYDLHYFTDSLQQYPFDIGLQPVRLRARWASGHKEKVKPASAGVGVPTSGPGGASMSVRKSGLLLWSILIFILLMLTFVSIKLARAVSQKEKHDRL
jgi:hypothetical protein